MRDVLDDAAEKSKTPGKRTLLGNVKAVCAIRIVVSAAEELAKDRIVTAGKV